jgi:hypothetical protein
VLVQDRGLPASRSGPAARVIVNVIRNQQTPEFKSEPYNKNITEAVEMGKEIFQVRAEDKDSRVGTIDVWLSFLPLECQCCVDKFDDCRQLNHSEKCFC